jgi:hypothetical protein
MVSDYAPLNFNSPWYVRKEILLKHVIHPQDDTKYESDIELVHTLQQSSRLENGSAIRLVMTTEHEHRSIPLRRIGVLFASKETSHTGDAELHVTGPHRAEFSARFNLSSVVDNEYRYFEVPQNVYMTGEVRAISGSGIRVWEGHLEQTSTCLIYEYVDGTRAYTPACPLADPLRGGAAISH